jgi:choline dehydrogenase
MKVSADYVIVGAGTAGCVLANRLTKDPKRSVILLEAGEKDQHPYIHVPAGFVRLLAHPTVTWGYKTAADPATAGREILFPRGRGLGGSSSINGLLYVRPFAADIDAWEQQGARGWSFENCLPYYSRSETWLDGADPRRGADGPIQVTRVGNPPEICRLVIEAGREAGLEFVDDPNARTRGPSVWYYQQTREGRRRSSAARGYLRPAMRRKNLQVITALQVSSLRFNDRNEVTGIVGTDASGNPVEIEARSEVILASGVVNTPKLLELSGIGDADVLANAGIRPRVVRPGVGRNFQDHYVVRLSFRVSGTGTANERSQGIALAREVAKYLLSGSGLLTYSAAVVGAFVQMQHAQRPDVQLLIAPGSFKSGRIGELEAEPGISCGSFQMRPESRGETHIQSRDPAAPPIIAPRYLTNDIDRKTIVEGLKFGRQLFSQPAIAKYIVGETVPGPQADTDEALLQYAQENGSTVYHAVGTCRMGEDENAVVDSNLRVHGVKNLSIVDASIMPLITSTNTNATVLMLAERAADLILGRKSLERAA